MEPIVVLLIILIVILVACLLTLFTVLYEQRKMKQEYRAKRKYILYVKDDGEIELKEFKRGGVIKSTDFLGG